MNMAQQFKPRLAGQIHRTAMVHPQAQIGYNVTIGPYAIIGANVELGDHCTVGPHVSIDGWTKVGQGNHFFNSAAIGYEPQDFSYQGEETYLYIGANNIFHEKVTIHRGTASGSKETRIGDGNIFMPGSHVAHDCQVGHQNILDTGATLAGHVTLEDWIVIGGMSGIHQFCKIGTMALIRAMTKIVKDIPPFILVEGNPAKVTGVNLSGLRKNRFSQAVSQEIIMAYKLLYHSNLRLDQALETMEQKLQNSWEIEHFISFIRNAKRGIQR
jgi:UDP-N-acetylglucosamine acyltransferase